MSDMIKNGVHGCTKEEKYTYPSDPVIRERLEWFRDQKLALMIHFGPYSQMNGIDASWPLSEEDADEDYSKNADYRGVLGSDLV
jgi:alpha-L-fucosidase